MSIGLVKWFDDLRGFGVLGTPDLGDVFFHKNNILFKDQEIDSKDPLVFTLKRDDRKQRNTGVNVRKPDSFDDFFSLMIYLGNSDLIPVEVKVLTRDYRKNTYVKKETRTYSLLSVVFQKVFLGKEVSETVAVITSFYHDRLDRKFFLEFAEFLFHNVPLVFNQQKSNEILRELSEVFKNSIDSDTLFSIWKKKKFAFIGIEENKEYEIPREILEGKSGLLNVEELDRIKHFSYGEEFTDQYISNILSDLSDKNFHQLLHCYQLSTLLEEPEKSQFEKTLGGFLFNRTLIEFSAVVQSQTEICNDDDFLEFSKIFNKLPEQLSDVQRDEIQTGLLKLVESKICDQYKPILWVRGFYPDTSFEIIKNYFLDETASTEIKKSIIDKLGNEQSILLKSSLQDKITKRILTESQNISGLIDNDLEFDKYNNFLTDIPVDLINDFSEIKTEVHKIIISKSTEDYTPQLWRKGILPSISEEMKIKFFLDESTGSADRVFILAALDQKDEIKFFMAFLKQWGVEETFSLLKKFSAEKYDLDGEAFDFENLFDKKYWHGEEASTLVHAVLDQIADNKNDDEKLDLFRKGLIGSLPEHIILKNLADFSLPDLKKILISGKENQNFILKILVDTPGGLNMPTLTSHYSLASDFLEPAYFTQFDREFYSKLDDETYFQLWEKGVGKIIPENSINDLLSDNLENYTKIDEWVSNGIVTHTWSIDYLWFFLEKHEPVKNRIIFAKTVNHIRYLSKRDSGAVSRIIGYNNSFYNLILWFLEKEEHLDFHTLKDSFIYFAPRDQVKIVKRLFYLKATGRLELNVNNLNELTRFDLDLYKLNRDLNPDVPVDISTDIIIKALISFQSTGKFLVESEILSYVLSDMVYLDKTRFQLKDYFANCEGRMKFTFDWNTARREIHHKKENDLTFFEVNFPYSSSLVDAVKTIPGRSYNADNKNWRVPGDKATEVLAFAKKHRFLVRMEGSSYANNAHLATKKRCEIPTGIKFCEGRESKAPDYTFAHRFYWCKNEPCFERCEAINTEEEWEKYTLHDFCEILGLQTDDKNSAGDIISKGKYYQFVGLINRFNRLLARLFCQECDHMLRPYENSHFAAHAVVRFCCENDQCSKKRQVIYLNHCLNGKCGCIIDSRESKECENGLYICPNCGGCCSHEMLSRRLSSLKLTGAYIHPNLEFLVAEKKGHSERAEYFCYKCQKRTEETTLDVFYCPDCKVKYDTTPYKLKRPNKNLRQDINSLGSGSPGLENDDLPF